MADAVVFIGLNSAEYYKELNKLGRVTDQRLASVERSIERRERDLARAMAEHNRVALDQMVEDAKRRSTEINRAIAQRFELPGQTEARARRGIARMERAEVEEAAKKVAERQRLAKVNADGLQANAAIERRLEQEAKAARGAELRDYVRHQERMAASRRAYANRLNLGGVRGRVPPGGLRTIRSAASSLGLGRLTSGASLATMGVGAAAWGGISLITKGWQAAAREQEKYKRAHVALSKEIHSLWSDVGQDAWVPTLLVQATTAAVRGFHSLRNGVANLLRGDSGGLVDAARAERRGRDAEYQRRVTVQDVEQSIFGLDEGQELRRRANMLIESNGLGGSAEAGRIRDRVQAEIDKRDRDKAREKLQREQDLARRARADDLARRASIASERAGRTEGFDDDREAARLGYEASMAQAEARVYADETIPLAQKYSQLTKEQALVREQYITQLDRIAKSEAEVTEEKERQARRDKELAESLATRLKIDRAMAEGHTAEASRLRAGQEYEDTVREINDLKSVSDSVRASMLADAAAIRDRAIAPKTSSQSLGAGLLGGATLLRQMVGGPSQAPQSETARNTGRIVRLLEVIRDKLDRPQAAVAV